ncbi:MAG: hypothetical protein GEU98_28700 [Pseudonocardiaceae bacterium]|nr:hypothetical protein [Pseudonocardiaceae bacterium]
MGGERLYVLVEPEHGGPELSPTEKDNELCLWLYTGVRLLIESRGDGQPYAATTAAEIVTLAAELDVTVLAAIDMWHPGGARYPEPDRHDFDPLEPLDDQPPPEEPVVWIPTRPVRAGDRRVNAELHGTRAGEKLLLVFESPEQAWAACGQFQAVSAIRADRIDKIAQDCGANGVVFNGWLDEDVRHTAPIVDWLRR